MINDNPTAGAPLGSKYRGGGYGVANLLGVPFPYVFNSSGINRHEEVIMLTYLCQGCSITSQFYTWPT